MRYIVKTEKIAYINVDLATQVSYPVISILGEVLQTLRPYTTIRVTGMKSVLFHFEIMYLMRWE